MEKILDFNTKWGSLIVLVLISIVFFRSCNTNKELEVLNEQFSIINSKIDSIPTSTISKKEIELMLNETMWEFLEKEELADKQGISITRLKHVNDR